MSELTGLRVLVVEDEVAVALMIEGMLEDLGCEIAASVARLAEARDVAAAAQIDLAVLDVNLHGQLVYPVAQILAERGIPFVFSTGYGASGLPSEMATRPVLSKPYFTRELERAILTALRSGAGGSLARL
jgi:CheY-like chemotaxis protein